MEGNTSETLVTMKAFKVLAILLLLFGNFSAPVPPQSNVDAQYSPLLLAYKLNVLFASQYANGFCLPAAGNAVAFLLLLLIYWECRCHQEKPLRKAALKVKMKLL